MIRKFEKDSSRRWALRSGVFAALLALVLLPSLAGAQTIAEKYQLQRERRSQFNLASSATMVLAVNQYQCGLVNDGSTCTDVFDSPTGGGGFWPTGSSNQYMFNSGLQVVGQIPVDAGFAWAGDTVGAFFMDASGLRQHGTAVTEIYNSLDAADMENWPVTGFHPDFPFLNGIVDDTALFADVLIGRKAASQQDSWVAYWDGDPNKSGGRAHPMGIMVEQRSMAWNYPAGNEASVYFVYKFTNVTNNPRFQRENESKFGIQLPDGGWTFDNIYVAFDSDPDVGSDAGNNYATAILPFNLGLAYNGVFIDNAWTYPTALFHPPFFADAPGFSGVKYLRSPIDPLTGEQVGLSSFSLHTNGAPFNDPRTVEQGWRYISLNVDAGKGDPTCSFDDEEVQERKSCFLAQVQSDVRMFVGSGPFTLGPGESSTIAVMQYAAATVEDNPNGLPTIVQGADNVPGIPSATPGCPDAHGDIAPIRPIDVAAGWIGLRPGVSCPAPGEVVDQYDVDVVPESLLGRGIVAQSIFDNKFLLGFAPEAPVFYLVPGDNQVTVVWEPSATEEAGDPFYAAAGDPTNPLYDPNYREHDVEGYRIYRGTSPANLQLIAQFDYAGTEFRDVLCITDPEHITGTACTDTAYVDIVSPFVQYQVVDELATGTPLPTSADTALSTEQAAGTSGPMNNSGVPFAFIDTEVKNGFQYFYKVTAFDINSVRSGPSSLESAAPAKSVMPVSPASSLSQADFSSGLVGRGVVLEGRPVGLSGATGMFTGPQPPTDGLRGEFQAFAPQLLPTGTWLVRIDSIHPDYYGGVYFLTASSGDTEIHLEHAPEGDFFELPPVSIASDPTLRQNLIDQGVNAPPLAGAMTVEMEWDDMHWSSGDSDWAYLQPGFWDSDPPNTINGGSRWFAGANESTPNPTVGWGTAGSLPGIEAIYSPGPYRGTPSHLGLSSDLMRRFYQSMWAVKRAADVRVYWGAAGVDSVIDITHNVPVAFRTSLNATYGFINDGDNNGVLNWGDIRYAPAPLASGAIPSGFSLTPSVPLATQPVVTGVDTNGDMASDGQGFAMYINGEMFFFRGAVPTGTVWTLRTYSGAVTGGPGGYGFVPKIRTPGVPGLAFQVTVNAPAQIVAANADLTQIHTVPDPYYASSLFDRGPATKELQFVNLPAEATIRIYSLSGVLVDIVNHSDPAGGGIAAWNLRNRSNQFVGSGVYFFHVTTPDGKEHTGKFTVVNSGFAR